MNLSWRRLHRRRPWTRQVQASFRDTLVLLNEFKSTLAGFALVLVAGGWLYAQLSAAAGQPLTFPESAFLVLSMIFLQANTSFPAEWYRQIFFFIMPVIGLAVLARGADFGVLLFNRRLRGEAWQVAVSSTYSNHIILIGLGHLGFRVSRELYNIGEELVVIEQDPKADLLIQAQAMDIPIIQADATKPETLEAAGVPRARAIILCTSNDTSTCKWPSRPAASTLPPASWCASLTKILPGRSKTNSASITFSAPQPWRLLRLPVQPPRPTSRARLRSQGAP